MPSAKQGREDQSGLLRIYSAHGVLPSAWPRVAGPRNCEQLDSLSEEDRADVIAITARCALGCAVFPKRDGSTQVMVSDPRRPIRKPIVNLKPESERSTLLRFRERVLSAGCCAASGSLRQVEVSHHAVG